MGRSKATRLSLALAVGACHWTNHLTLFSQQRQGLSDAAFLFLELRRILFLPIGDEKKEWILPKNLKGLIGLGQML